MAATHSLAVAAAADAPPPPPSRMKKTIKHDIFVSHSGKQKGFAKDLATRLSSEGYTVFFDQNNDSLPPGEDFPSHIFCATRACKLALVLLCEGFVTSCWPVTELCSFVDRPVSVPAFTILPLFFKLSPADLKAQENVRKWQIEWERFERENKHISAAKCEEAVTKVLPRLNGVNRRLESEQGEGSYIDDIMERIYSILPRRILSVHRYGASPDKQYVGMERFCQIILDKFGELEDSQSDGNITNVCILGMHGVSGSGKSTLCNFMCNAMFDEFMGKVIHVELPTELRGDDDSRIKEQYTKLLSTICPHTKDTFASTDLVQLYNLLLAMGTLLNHKMFLVFDNISPSNYGSYERIVKAILCSDVLGSGSRVMLVGQSSVTLENLLKEVEHRYRYAITEIPCLTKEEAMEVIRQNRYPSVEEDAISHLLDKCSFPSSSFMYVPFVLEQIGVLLRKKCGPEYLKQLELLSKMVDECKKDAIRELVEITFKRLRKDLKVLFFDIALFIIPVGYSKLSDATPILCRMHDMTDTDAFKLEWMIKELMEHCALSETEYGELRVHDIYAEYARSIPGNSKSYVDERCLNISDKPTMSPIRLHQLEYLDARTICIDSGCHYDEEIRLHVEVGTRTRALFVRNSRKYCNCILALSGDLSSLVCLLTKNVQVSPTGSYFSLSNLVRVDIRNSDPKDIPMKARNGQHGRWISRILDSISYQIQNSMQSVRVLRTPYFPWEGYLATYDKRVSNGFGFTKQMTWLRVLILENAGIRRLEITGRLFPALEDLQVYSTVQQPIDVNIENLPNLKRLVARALRSGYGCYKSRSSVRILGYDCSWQSRKLSLQLGECLELQRVDVDGSFDEVNVVGLLPSTLRDLFLFSDRSLRFGPSELIRSSIHQCSLLQRLDLCCMVVENMTFTRRCLGCVPCLEMLSLAGCESLRRLSVGPGCMPKLVELNVYVCGKLEAFEGIEHILPQLGRMGLLYLPQLQVECDVGSGSYNLKDIHVDECPLVKIDWNVLMMTNVSQRMERICLEGTGIISRRLSHNVDESKALLLTSSSSTVALDRLTFLEGRFTLLKDLELKDVDHLREIEGLQHLPNLLDLCLWYLPHLARVSGTWPTTIRCLDFRSCPMLLEIPPMEQQMPNLERLSFERCARLKGVEGRFGEMKELESVEFVGCESMETFPMEDVMEELGKRWEGYGEYGWTQRLRVYGSKFASAEVMQTWLSDAEIGSPLWKAAMEVLLLQGAADVLIDYFSALPDDTTEADRRYLRGLFLKCRMVYAKKPEVNLLVERLLHEFPQLLLSDYRTSTQLEI